MIRIGTLQVSIAVLIGWIISAVLATPSAVAIIADIEQGKPITSSALWGALLGLATFTANTLIHLTSQSSGPPTPTV